MILRYCGFLPLHKTGHSPDGFPGETRFTDDDGQSRRPNLNSIAYTLQKLLRAEVGYIAIMATLNRTLLFHGYSFWDVLRHITPRRCSITIWLDATAKVS